MATLPPLRTCAQCGEQFGPRRGGTSRPERPQEYRRRRFCSRRCAAIAAQACPRVLDPEDNPAGVWLILSKSPGTSKDGRECSIVLVTPDGQRRLLRLTAEQLGRIHSLIDGAGASQARRRS